MLKNAQIPSIFCNFAFRNDKINNQEYFIMELTGKIIAVLPANSGVSARTGNPWMSQEFVIEVPGQYSRKCVFRIFGEDRIKQFNIQNGEDLTVSFDIDAHEYNGRWFNQISAYNVVRAAQVVPGAMPGVMPSNGVDAGAPFPPAQGSTPAAPAANGGSSDDLPF